MLTEISGSFTEIFDEYDTRVVMKGKTLRSSLRYIG